MMSLEEALVRLQHEVDRGTLENYIAHFWVRPIVRQEIWYFEEIDISRVQLVHHLKSDMLVGDDAMDVVLKLLDQLYNLRWQMHKVSRAIERQPEQVQKELRALLEEMGEE